MLQVNMNLFIDFLCLDKDVLFFVSSRRLARQGLEEWNIYRAMGCTRTDTESHGKKENTGTSVLDN
jgi:hypothetical protein